MNRSGPNVGIKTTPTSIHTATGFAIPIGICLTNALVISKRLICICLLGLSLVSAGQGQIDEYQVKAAFLYNFAKFLEWPADAFKGPTDPIVVCVLGQNPFGDGLEQAMNGKTVEGRPFAVRQLSEPTSAHGCHIVFVSSSESKRIKVVLEALRGSGALTVGDTPGFATDGGVINFRLDGGRVRFEINVGAATVQHLRLSSKLLNLAQIVKQ